MPETYTPSPAVTVIDIADVSQLGRVVITGGAGFLGSWLCETLLDAGVDVVCIDNFATGVPVNIAHLLTRSGFTMASCDVTSAFTVAGSVDVVFHLASPASPLHYQRLALETLRVGSDGTRNALELAVRTGARFVLASTSEVYGDPLEHPQREDYWGNVNPIGPRSMYDEAKRYAEALTAAYRRSLGVDTGIVRIFNTYGPRMRADDGRAVPTFVRQAISGQPMTVAGDGRQTRSLCYVADTVRGICAMAVSTHPGPINIGNPQETTVLELAEQIRAAAGSSSPISFVDLPADDPKRRCPEITRARQVLGWEPRVSSATGLTLTLEWAYRQASPTARVPFPASSPPR
jgi:dTDP-glucose 4,6-dehydratase